MLFNWNEQTLRWFEEASEYTGYNRELAKLLLPRLKGVQTLCDIGCGMALVDFEMASSFEDVFCVDLNETVLEYVRNRAAEKEIRNLHTVTADGKDRDAILRGIREIRKDAGPALADGVTVLFHGSIEVMGEQYLSYAEKTAIFVVHANAFGTTGPEKYRVRKCCDTDSTRAWLEAHGISYEYEAAELEFGQPHRSLEDAVDYTRAFSAKVPEEELLPYVKEHVTETGRADFPLYTPKKRSFGIFTIRK